MPSRARRPAPPAKDASPARGGGRSRSPPAKEPPARRRRSPSRRRGQKAKGKIRQGKYTLKLKGWLKTPQDWARFNAWAKVNALPKKYPEPEPIERPSKPLSKLRKRLKIMALPKLGPDPSVHCRLDWSIPRSALKIVASKRLMLLALPRVKLCDYGRVYYKVSPGALTYVPSERILALSKPRDCIREKRKFDEDVADPNDECKSQASSLCAEGSRGIDEDRLNELAECKKLLKNPGVLTPEEIAMIFTPLGVNRRALVYKITPWMEYIALPKYTTIKFRKDKAAKDMRKDIVEKKEQRGKEALAEQQKRTGTKRKHGETEEKDGGEGDAEDEAEKKEREEKIKKRKLEQNAWRYTPYPCKEDAVAFTTKKSALEGTVPPGVEKLAQPIDRKSKACKAKPFTVKKAALSASASGRVASLAEPRKPLGPVEKKPPREKDKYGRPIIPMPPYGKVLPKTKPYKMGECPSDEGKKKKIVRKQRPIDPIAYEASYDPCDDPELAKRQKRERKRAEKMGKLKPKKERKPKKKEEKSEEQQEETQEEEQEETREETQEETQEEQQEEE